MTEETALKHQVKEYLAIKGVFNFPLLQGMAGYKGLPDRMIFKNGMTYCVELKSKKGKLSQHQEKFKADCEANGITYLVVRELEDIMKIF